METCTWSDRASRSRHRTPPRHPTPTRRRPSSSFEDGEGMNGKQVMEVYLLSSEKTDDDHKKKKAAGFFLIVLVVVVVLGPCGVKAIDEEDESEWTSR
jgi:hypothetical protein